MTITWDKSLETGIKLMDEDHYSIVVEYNELNDMKTLCDRDVYYSVLTGFLEKYIRVHFKQEEALQEEVAYPFIEGHKKYMNSLKQKLNNILMAITITIDKKKTLRN